MFMTLSYAERLSPGRIYQNSHRTQAPAEHIERLTAAGLRCKATAVSTTTNSEYTELFGTTRNVVKGRYALDYPGRLGAELPAGLGEGCVLRVHLARPGCPLLPVADHPGEGRQCAGNTGANQYFVYVLEGSASILLEARKHRLEPGSYAYLPSGQDVHIASGAAATRLLVFQKEYEPLHGVAKPRASPPTSAKSKASRSAAMRTCVCKPSCPPSGFDMAIDIRTSQPGAVPPAVEAPVMERDS